MLPLPTVVIEQAPDVPEPIRQAVLEGCAQGLGEDRCVSSDSSLDPSMIEEEQPRESFYEAQLEWSEDYQHVRIIVTLQPGRLERDIQFQLTDRPEEKGAAAGLIAATAVATHLSLRAEATSEPKPEQEPAPPTPQSAPRPVKTDAPGFSADLGLNVGAGLRDGPLAWGANGRISWRTGDIPFFPVLALSYSGSEGAVASRRWRTWLGGGLALDLAEAPLALELSAGMLGEHFAVATTLDDERDRASALRWGGTAGADIIWKATRSMHFFFGAQTSFAWPDVNVSKESQAVDYQGVFSWTATSGIRINL